jgi:ribA/ribD-fused uncharacterized protein
MVLEFRNEYYFLSNMFECEVVYKGIKFRSSESLFQALKACNNEDFMKFINLNGFEAKKLGRCIKLRKDWNEVRVNIMYEVLKLKFSNPELRAKLLATGYEELIEGNNWNDKFWGVSLKDYKGENHLGRLLMIIRKEIREEEAMKGIVFSVDSESDINYYIIYKNGEFFTRLPKKGTDLNYVKEHFQIKE